MSLFLHRKAFKRGAFSSLGVFEISDDVKIHSTAEVSDAARIGKGTRIWHHSQVRENARIGRDCVISKNVYIDFGVNIGNKVKIQNNVSVYHGVTIEDCAFIGPHVCFTNDKIPRAVNPDETVKGGGDWEPSETVIKKGASIGANSTILSGITIGEWALVGAGSLVTKDVPDYALVCGTPAKIVGYVCKCGKKLDEDKRCEICGTELK